MLDALEWIKAAVSFGDVLPGLVALLTGVSAWFARGRRGIMLGIVTVALIGGGIWATVKVRSYGAERYAEGYAARDAEVADATRELNEALDAANAKIANMERERAEQDEANNATLQDAQRKTGANAFGDLPHGVDRGLLRQLDRFQ